MAAAVEAVRNTVAENFGGGASKAAAKHQFSLTDVPDLTDKVAVVTGATEGIGYAVSHTLLAHNLAKIHMLSPSQEVAESAINAIKTDLGEACAQRVTWHQVDLADLKKVEAIGQRIANGEERLDILVNNGARGIMSYQIAETTGLDRHMSVNHLGHVVLTSLLLPLLKKTASNGHTVRISNQGSNAHQSTPSDTAFASANELKQDLGPNGLYGRSKLANILHARYLDRHLNSAYPKILANATHPGFVHTAMSTRDIHEPYPLGGYAMSTLMKPLKKDQWEGALSLLFTATKTECSGEYICPPAIPEPGSKQAQDSELGERLMKLTREILTEKLGGKWEDF